mmetsp:Transcript_32962/g.32651  ORF Transcript_32962/g.32651 Transcript_32962/m.32651 type:complete len:113 (+) Transcript_32962:1-339(+)
MEEELSQIRLDEIVKIITGDDQVFYIEKCYADMSYNMKCGLNCVNMESINKEFRFPDIRGEVMEKVIQYLHYKLKYQQLLDRDVVKMNQVPKFELDPELALDVLIAANYLQC